MSLRKKKRNLSRYVKEARTAQVLYRTAAETLPLDDDGRKVGYAGLEQRENGKRRIHISAELTDVVDSYGLDLYTVVDENVPMSMVASDYAQLPSETEADYAEYRNELRTNLGKLLDSL
jgi:hypothetical protein